MSLPLTFVLAAMFAGPLVAAEPIPVKTQTFSALAIFPKHSAPATVVSENQSRISAEIQARILDIPVRTGDSVDKDALLIQLDPQDFKFALKRADAALAAVTAKLKLAKYELNRARTLSKSQTVSEQLLKKREAEHQALLADHQGQQAAFEQAQLRLDKTQIRAPFNAVIVERIGQVGELASPGTALLRIIDTDKLELSAKIQHSQTADLQRASEPTTSKNTRPQFSSAGQRFAVSLRIVTPVLDTQARTREARLQFTSDKPLPGATGKLMWSPAQASLPAELVSQRDGKLGVFVLTANKARFVVLPQAQTGRPALTELAPNTLIITEGRYRLQDGSPVKAQ